MILPQGTSLKAVLGGSVSANQPECRFDYRDWTPDGNQRSPGSKGIATNNGTAVIVVDATTANDSREVQEGSIYNKDTAAVTVTVKTDNGTTEYIVRKQLLGIGETLAYTSERGWYLLTSDALVSTWTPTRSGFTEVGTPVLTGRFERIGNLAFFEANVVPGTTVASVAGTSYISLPVSASASGIGAVVTATDFTTKVALGVCVIDYANSRCYTPAWAASGDTFQISGFYEV